ncbi:MAG: hypothetical protein H7Y13_12135 [Sphingobacteriaceae bacterium]|nr:hypothetical protein [Sphingobacteriaceae bacterium]
MFSQISWQQYFAYVAVTGLLYYIVVVALYYRNQLFRLVKNPLKQGDELPTKNSYVSYNQQDILGKAVDFNSPDSIAATDLQFAGDNEDTFEDSEPDLPLSQNEHTKTSNQALGDSEGFTNEFKNNLSILKEAEGTKDEFISLFTNTASKYPGLNNASTLQTLNLFILELISAQELGFLISAQELGEYWEESFQISSSVNQ